MVSTVSARRLRVAAIPASRPATAAKGAATSTSDSVCIDGTQTPNTAR